LNDNQIRVIEGLDTLKQLQQLNLQKNPLNASEKQRAKARFPSTTFFF
jgi:Leucine-rich repeat (LRR) protein